MDGYETCRCLRWVPGMEKIVIAAVSGYGSEEDRRKPKEAGFDRYLLEPVGWTAVAELFRSAAKGGSPCALRTATPQQVAEFCQSSPVTSAGERNLICENCGGPPRRSWHAPADQTDAPNVTSETYVGVSGRSELANSSSQRGWDKGQ